MRSLTELILRSDLFVVALNDNSNDGRKANDCDKSSRKSGTDRSGNDDRSDLVYMEISRTKWYTYKSDLFPFFL